MSDFWLMVFWGFLSYLCLCGIGASIFCYLTEKVDKLLDR
jgi:hypothetical protein